MDVSLIVVVVVVTALVFDFTNGFHDTANAMATSIATGAFGPRTAVTVAACLNVLGALLSVEVATTFAVSWKPLVKSNASAVATTMTRMMSLSTERPAACYEFLIAMPSRMFATVSVASIAFSSFS